MSKHSQPSDSRPRGLPHFDSLVQLAETYLRSQSAAWSTDLVLTVYGNASPEQLSAMATQFTTAYSTESVAPVPMIPTNENVQGIGCAYLRFSDDNSNPRSLHQQLTNILPCAAGDGCWIAWERVFADAAIPGTTENRPGYQLAKSLATLPDTGVDAIYIDELSRLNREQIASLQFGQDSRNAGVTIVGVTDGFRSDNKMSKVAHAMTAMQHEMFSDQLKDKVIRGERDAFLSGKPVGLPPTGLKLIPS